MAGDGFCTNIIEVGVTDIELATQYQSHWHSCSSGLAPWCLHRRSCGFDVLGVHVTPFIITRTHAPASVRQHTFGLSSASIDWSLCRSAQSLWMTHTSATLELLQRLGSSKQQPAAATSQLCLAADLVPAAHMPMWPAAKWPWQPRTDQSLHRQRWKGILQSSKLSVQQLQVQLTSAALGQVSGAALLG
jgi:hypothetical protein